MGAGAGGAEAVARGGAGQAGGEGWSRAEEAREEALHDAVDTLHGVKERLFEEGKAGAAYSHIGLNCCPDRGLHGAEERVGVLGAPM